ncbi:hypothetical protein Pla110_17860 [Polystyrenella longa]|uniref:Transposase InsH N-terminal domain-containing protein n=1 Tax=Polystyrenella longa TaxID=2528007 RepID=A0A518CLL8_9PLAN|nr:transposase [Polystyrenella longa]QDU80064.1 hypothetical protein Pla110_17860 [Polystyrenella longa]
MSLGKREHERQESLCVETRKLTAPGHHFYIRLNKLLREAGFDAFLEELCAPCYHERGRKSIPPGVYFRMLMVGYFEGIDSQRGIAWRCADSLSLRQFLGLPLEQQTPDHSRLTRIRDRFPRRVYEQVFQFILEIMGQHDLLSGQAVGVDSTTLEANAAMKSIVRKDSGEDWNAYATGLMREAGVIEEDEEPSDDERRKFDQQRSEKVERSFAHTCETGGARRIWLRGMEKINKRYLLQGASRNLGTLMRSLFGTGSPRGLQRAMAGLLGLCIALVARFNGAIRSRCQFTTFTHRIPTLSSTHQSHWHDRLPTKPKLGFSTGC